MTRHRLIRIPVAMVLALMIIIGAVVPLYPANATSGGVVYGAPQPVGKANFSDQAKYKYRAEDIREIPVSTEYVLGKIEQTFGPEVAAAAKYRVETPVQSYDYGDGTRFAECTKANWCGYQVQDINAKAVRADMTVRHCTGSNAANGAFVGLGAFVDDESKTSLIQCGYSMGNSKPFKAFYELLPAKPVYLFAVDEGDELHATVQWDPNMSSYYVCVVDQTKFVYWAGNFNYQPDLCAEWIVETPPGPWYVGYQWYIGQFGIQDFTDAYWWNSENPYVTYSIDQSSVPEGSSHWLITEHTNHNQWLYASALGGDHRSFTVSRNEGGT